MYLFFDTETTGLPKNWKAPVSDVNNWPRLVQLGYLFYDKNGEIIESGDFIIKQEGYTIPAASSRVHGISTEQALQEGKPITSVMEKFEDLVNRANYLVAHNMAFDEKILGAELLRSEKPNGLASKKKICTMKKTTDFCKIPGMHGYKWPKLSELHYKLFNEYFEEAHNASADIEATARCFWELRRLGVL